MGKGFNKFGRRQGFVIVFVLCLASLSAVYFSKKPSIGLKCNRSVSNYELKASNGESTFFQIPNEYVGGSQSTCAVAITDSIYLGLLFPNMAPAANLPRGEDGPVHSDIIRLELVAGLPTTLATLRSQMILPPQVKEVFGLANNGLLFLGVNPTPKHGIRGRSFVNDPKLGVIARQDEFFHYVPQSLDQTHVAYISCAFSGEFESTFTGTFLPGYIGNCRVRSLLTEHTRLEYSIPTTKLGAWDLIDRKIRSTLSNFIISSNAPNIPASMESN